MEEYIIRETEDFLALSTLFNESGMGVKIEERMPDRIIKMWRMDDPVTGELMAASTLEKRDGVYSLGDIAVRNDLHRKGYGKVMQRVVFDEAKSRGIKELWACAKEPAYYLHSGWEKMVWDESPNIAVYCTSCGKRGTTCHPEIMRYTLD
ncbi:MAG: GNAT family N-acetyltransferase [Clostridia bacterium]|nr:GNAT family N-acetyltransferase [Clostridia bacterium]